MGGYLALVCVTERRVTISSHMANEARAVRAACDLLELSFPTRVWAAHVDEEAAVRANTTILLGNLAPHLGEGCMPQSLGTLIQPELRRWMRRRPSCWATWRRARTRVAYCRAYGLSYSLGCAGG